MHARALAAQVIRDLIRRRSPLPLLLPACQARLASQRDRALLQEIVYGVMRWYFRLDFFLKQLLTKDLKAGDLDIRALILAGLYQLAEMRIPDHAAVSATVAACDELGKSWARDLVNALLRRYQRERSRLRRAAEDDPVAKHAHPRWLLEALAADFPGQWQAIVEANNQRPPMFLRVNRKQTNREAYLEKLDAAGLEARPAPFTTVGIRLNQAVDVSRLPSFFDGHVSVQDLAAQLAVPLLDIRAGHRVLDACAAPGGKLAHLLELVIAPGEVVAVEYNAARLQQLRDTLDRLRLDATVIHADARLTSDWWDGRPFDRVLLDAPCSATGVIRRHPDIKILRQPADVAGDVERQSELLSALWPLLKSGGKLLYVTCSVLAQENDRQIEAFTATHPDASRVRISADWGQATTCGRQSLTGQFDMDGFYYACLEKC